MMKSCYNIAMESIHFGDTKNTRISRRDYVHESVGYMTRMEGYLNLFDHNNLNETGAGDSIRW